MNSSVNTMTPSQIVAELDQYIVGQKAAKRAVAVALRNRFRRQQVSEELRREIYPKNILMIGPTGVGKTEIARRLSKLTGAPFIKVEATKYTEVGYVGRDVESMIRDLMNSAINMVKTEHQEKVRAEAQERVENQIVELLLQQSSRIDPAYHNNAPKIREALRRKELDEVSIEISVQAKSPFPSFEIFSGNVAEEIELNLGPLSNILGGGKKKKKVTTIKIAREILLSEELEKMLDQDQIIDIARERVQNLGIIFIDEIDKIASRESKSGPDVSREGVQRDILPIVEGSQVNTKYGIIDTSHILFIAAGAFHMTKPSDLIPELQGRFPIRVELEALTVEDFKRILIQPKNSLIAQYKALMDVEGVEVEFSPEAIDELARWAWEVNSRTENIGARRLHTVLEAVLEELSFSAPDIRGQKVVITPAYVQDKLKPVVEDRDLARYIL